MAATTGTDGADIDLYADNFEEEFPGEHEYDNNPPEADLYDDVIAPSTASAGIKEENGSANNNNHSSGHEDSIGREGEGHRSSKVSIYIGNLSWWTSDTDVIDAIKAIGVTDVSDVKFFENRANGQSKGFCVANLGSEASYRAVMEKLPKSEVHGQNPVVTQCNRQSLNHFELQSRKMTPGAPGQGPPGQGVLGNAPPGMGMSSGGPVMRPYGAPNMVSSGSAPGMRPPLIGRQPRPNGPLLGQPRMPMQTNSAPNHYGQQGYAPRGPPPLGSYGQPGRPMRPLMPHPMSGPPRHGGPLLRAPGPPPSDRSHEWSDHSQGGMHSSSGMNSNYSMHSSQPPMSRSSGHPQGANNVHLNPAFIQGSHSSPPDYSRGPSSASYGDYRSDISSHGLSEAEAEEILQKNRTVCSGAISRSIGDAASGDFSSAIDNLNMAIGIIKQSRVAHDERCKALVSSLQDTLEGVQKQAYPRGRDRSRDRHRSRSPRRDKRPRSRSREYRDRSRERDRYHDRYHDDRYHDKERDHRRH